MDFRLSHIPYIAGIEAELKESSPCAREGINERVAINDPRGGDEKPASCQSSRGNGQPRNKIASAEE